jgi:hypothetical protein
MNKNLIIGAATGYKYEDMKYFFLSLKAIDFTGDVALLVSDKIDTDTRDQLIKQGVILIYIKSTSIRFAKNYANSRLWKIHWLPHKLIFALLNAGKNNIQRLNRYVKIFHLISGSRYCFYYDYLLANRDKYKYILVTDVRDVLFQADPFAHLEQDSILNFYQEDDPIKDSFYICYWVKHAFGAKKLEPIKDKMGICSGTTIGSVDRMLDYLENMIATQARITGGLTALGGFDQGIHNYLIYNNYFPGAQIKINGTAEVFQLGGSTPTLFNENQELVTSENVVIPVIHQFDRTPEIKLKAMK